MSLIGRSCRPCVENRDPWSALALGEGTGALSQRKYSQSAVLYKGKCANLKKMLGMRSRGREAQEGEGQRLTPVVLK